MKVRIEILRLEQGEQKVIGAITHEARALEAVAAAAQGMVDSDQLPERVDGYRIVTESGIEFYGWPNGGQGGGVREG
jgi:hypothetical protein